ncbi:MAG TPA: glutamine--fructose-6-phosphate transaminase (isomerizing), partial [Ruania sp.]|nr:glutamine--fructose-6-phosphate transaminase (isomerizing) [Ruania sp.]
LDELRVEESVLRGVDKIIVVACGTAAYAGHVAKYAVEHWCRIPVEVELAHEFRYRDPVVSEKTLVVAISQSGETMDTIMAIRHAREQGAKVLAIVNTHGSTIARESDAVLYTHAGPEVAVASTKAFIAQITACYLLGLYLAQLRGYKYVEEVADYLDELGQLPGKIQQILDDEGQIVAVAEAMKDTPSVLFLGRHVGFPVALEGALKLKELAYIHAEGFAAGELKHGPIALIEPGQAVFVIVPTPRRPTLHNKVVSNIQEIRARGARTLVIAEEGDDSVDEYAEVVFRVPRTPTLMMPLVTVVPLQIFACALAGAKGLDVDQPRNLAKSVTVE